MPDPTQYLGLNRPDFDISPWHDLVNDNFSAIDAIIFSLFGITNLKGVYKNSISVIAGERYADIENSLFYEAASDFTTEAAPTTFAQERASFPARWVSLDASAALDAASTAQAAASAASTSETNAANSAIAAAASLASIGTSLSDANNAATAAAASATASTNSAISSANSATAAANSVTAAAAEVSNAQDEVVNAQNEVTNAATQATNAANSATSAATQATNASNSATAAATAQAAAETARDAVLNVSGSPVPLRGEVRLARQVISSNVMSVYITGFDSALYDSYTIRMHGVTTINTNSTLYLRTSIDDITYNDGPNDYAYTRENFPMQVPDVRTQAGDDAHTHIQLAFLAAATNNISIDIDILSPHEAKETMIKWEGGFMAATPERIDGTGFRLANDDISSVLLRISGGGEITSGIFTLYGHIKD